MKSKNLKVQVLIGCPGSGKSTYAKYILRTEERWVRLSRDDFRTMQFSEANLDNNSESLISDLYDAMIEKSLAKNFNVMVDATHCRKEYLEHYIQKFNHLAEIHFKVFDENMEVLKQRCETRYKQNGKFISNKVIQQFYDELQLLKIDFNFEYRPKIIKHFTSVLSDKHENSCFVVDLDGTLADANGRNMYNPSDVEILKDIPILPVVEVVKLLAEKHQVIFLSGREESYYNVTKTWLCQHVFGSEKNEVLLFMRKNGDYRRDSIIKKELLAEKIYPYYNVIAAFDDRLQVIRECWNAENIFCFNVNQYLAEY